ncbi:ATPase, T2SS/T4P/T4SS family [Achromobacter mucicolens]|uniref:ATPase, T2SS/T4P/T4SS family n=1 Tax=Achromobacter mucicolens TaxID=1389922 RepID=UPI001CBB10CF|nr:ATPase, T2SS/T4P/T4SS family [Achromobacter mucicolens]UAN03088.1 Flp pilus assembly complex ATPase component TadA [Achromobacter mucicolens]
MLNVELTIELTFEDAAQQQLTLRAPVLIGRGVQCGLRIPTWRVGRQHAQLLCEADQIVLEDLGTLAGTMVNGARIVRHAPVQPQDEILIGPCRLRVSMRKAEAASPLDGADAMSSDPVQPEIRSMGDDRGIAPPVVPPCTPHRLHDRRRLHAALLSALDPRRRDVAGMSDGMLRAEAERLLVQIVATDAELPPHADKAALCREVLDEAVGLGPLEPLLAAPDITEIMVNRYDEIYVERAGRLWREQAAFTSEQSVRWVIERIVTPLGRRIDESSPMVDARLPDGSRVHAIIPPVAMKGASLTIRKFPQRRPQMPDLIALGALSDAMSQFLALCVRMRKNLVVSGGTGAGKTTLLNILSNEIPDGERVVTIEDAAELRLNHAHLVALEARPANQEGRGRIDIRELVRNALRMRPDRIVVGECRGAEAFDMLTAMNTGHEGSLTTLHANSPRDALVRLESMILMAGLDLPLSAVREHIAASVDVVVQQARLADGRRVVTSIVEVAGMESGRIQLQDLFGFDRSHGFRGCGALPGFARDWADKGVSLDATWFSDLAGQAPGVASFAQGLP